MDVDINVNIDKMIREVKDILEKGGYDKTIVKSVKIEGCCGVIFNDKKLFTFPIYKLKGREVEEIIAKLKTGIVKEHQYGYLVTQMKKLNSLMEICY